VLCVRSCSGGSLCGVPALDGEAPRQVVGRRRCAFVWPDVADCVGVGVWLAPCFVSVWFLAHCCCVLLPASHLLPCSWAFALAVVRNWTVFLLVTPIAFCWARSIPMVVCMQAKGLSFRLTRSSVGSRVSLNRFRVPVGAACCSIAACNCRRHGHTSSAYVCCAPC
jgi:hypothetical protein